MTRDEFDPLDDEFKPEHEAEGDLPEEAAVDDSEFSEEPLESASFDPGGVEQFGVESEGAEPAVSESQLPDAQAVPDSTTTFDNQKAVDRFFEAYREQQAAKRAAAGESEEEGLLPADAPLRRKDGFFYAEPRRLPPPTPFEELVFSYNKSRSPGPTPEIQERWMPPDHLPKGSQSAAAPAAPAEGEIKVTVEVRLTSEVRERITDQAIAKAAQTHQNHTEIVARRLYELTREIRDRRSRAARSLSAVSP